MYTLLVIRMRFPSIRCSHSLTQTLLKESDGEFFLEKKFFSTQLLQQFKSCLDSHLLEELTCWAGLQLTVEPWVTYFACQINVRGFCQTNWQKDDCVSLSCTGWLRDWCQQRQQIHSWPPRNKVAGSDPADQQTLCPVTQWKTTSKTTIEATQCHIATLNNTNTLSFWELS